MNDDLDHLLGALRSPATSDELAGESAVVDRMYHAHESKGPTMFTSRRTRVATLIAAGALGFGSVAAAGPVALEIFSGDDQVEQPDDGEGVVEDEDENTEDIVEEVGEEVVEDGEELVEEADIEDGEDVDIVVEKAEDIVEEAPELWDDPATDFDERMCLPGNHGKTVSAVARGELVIEGIEVRDAARSSCGKDFEVDEESEDGQIAESLEVEVEKIDEPKSKGKPDHAGGKSESRGKPDHAGGKSKSGDGPGGVKGKRG